MPSGRYGTISRLMMVSTVIAWVVELWWPAHFTGPSPRQAARASHEVDKYETACPPTAPPVCRQTTASRLSTRSPNRAPAPSSPPRGSSRARPPHTGALLPPPRHVRPGQKALLFLLAVHRRRCHWPTHGQPHYVLRAPWTEKLRSWPTRDGAVGGRGVGKSGQCCRQPTRDARRVRGRRCG